MFLTTYFSFDEVCLKIDVKLAAIIYNVRINLVEASETRSDLELSNSPFCIMEFSRFSQDLHVKNPRLFRIKTSFNI